MHVCPGVLSSLGLPHALAASKLLHCNPLWTECHARVLVCAACRPKGSFLRGCCDTFSLASAAGDIGRVEAVRVWHEPTGGSIGGGWCLHRLDVEAVFRGEGLRCTLRFSHTPVTTCCDRAPSKSSKVADC